MTFTVVEWLPVFVTKMFCRPKQVWRGGDTGHSNLRKTTPEQGKVSTLTKMFTDQLLGKINGGFPNRSDLGTITDINENSAV